MSRNRTTPDLELLLEGLVGQQRRLLTRDPWLPRSEVAVERQLREADREGVLQTIRREAAVLGLLDSDEGTRRLLGPVVLAGEWEPMAKALLDTLDEGEQLPGSVVKTATNTDNERRWRLLESRRFRRYNAEMTLTLAREEWVPGRKPQERFGRITKSPDLHRPEPPLRGRKTVRIRPYASRDREALRRLHPDSAYFSADTVIFRSENGGGMTFIAEEERGNRAPQVGYLYQEVEGRCGEICFVNVDESVRGRGIGTRLITTSLDDLFFDKGVELVEISVRPDNPAADLYRRIGFSPVVTYYSYERRF